MSRSTQGRVIAYRPEYATIAGSVAGGVFLAQLAYWQGKVGRAFFKSEADWRSETGLSRREYTNARRALREAGLLTERAGFRQVRFFRLDLGALEARLAALGERHEPVASASERVRPNCGSSHGSVGLNESVRTDWSNSVRTPCANSYQETSNTRLQKAGDRDFKCPAAPDERAPAQNYFRVHSSWADAPADTAQVAVNEAALVAEFDALYARWPRREKRGRARRAFLKAVREGLDKTTLFEGFERALSVYEFEDRQYVPMFSSWLTDQRWHDEHDDDEPADARVVVSPPAAAGHHRPGAARPGNDPDLARWRARGEQLMRGEPARPAPEPEPAPRPEPAERVKLEPKGAHVMKPTLDLPAGLLPGDGQPEAERPAPEAPPPEPARPAPEPARLESETESALAPGERELTHAEHMAMICAGAAGPALARGERRSAWPEHLLDAPKPPPFDPSLPPGTRALSFGEHMALLDQQRAERAARRAERCAARGRPAPEARPFA